MHPKDPILAAYGVGEMVIGKYLHDLSDADILVRPFPGQNHIAWQLGHLIASEHGMVEGVKPGSCPPLPEGFKESHSQKEESTTSNDPARFLKKDEYIALMTAQRDATKAALEAMTEAEFDTPSPEGLAKMAPRVGVVFALVGSHSLMHIGQFVSVRRKLGKPVSF